MRLHETSWGTASASEIVCVHGVRAHSLRFARLAEEHLAAALKQIRLALLEADVHFRVVKEFLARVEEKAIGEKVLLSLSPAQQVIKIVREELAATLGGEDAKELRVDGAPAVIVMCGLQGSGKTTTSGKLAKRLAGRGR